MINIWNNLDEVALYLGANRLPGEEDESLVDRLKRIGRYKYKTDYYTQVHTIPAQAGLNTYNLFNITSSTGNIFRCTLDWEYFTIEGSSEIIRIYVNNDEATIGKILDILDHSIEFSYSLYDGLHRNTACKNLIRNTNVKVGLNKITKKSTMLNNSNIITDTFVVKSSERLCLERVYSLADLKVPKQFYLDSKTGYLEVYESEFTAFYLTYEYLEDVFVVESTDLNLMPVNLLFKYGITNKGIDIMPYLLDGKTWGK
jgi:hypothetical protein